MQLINLLDRQFQGITVVSLFDGMSCGQIGLKEQNILIKTYYASETDKFAIAQTQLNFPDTIQLGDIGNWNEWIIDWSEIDLILAGSPCQGFSFAGKQLNFNDERSKLFFIFIDILNHCKKFNPDVKFLLENVNMKKEYQRVINNMLDLFPVRINSNLVSAQNRDRLYWTNIKIKMIGLFNEIYSDIPQPKDQGILLKDILQPESEIDEKYYLSDIAINRMLRKEYSNPKINPIKTGPLNTKNNSGQCSFDSGTTLINGVLNDKGNLKEIEKSSCIDANYFKGLDNHAQRTHIKIGCVKFGRSEEGKKIRRETKEKDYTPFQAKEINNIDYKKMNTVTCATTKDNLLLVQKGHGFNKGGIFEEKSPTLLSNSWEHNNHIDNGYKLRRLTPLECARLQTVPDWYKWNCSDTQQYKMLGNGWTIEVIKHIFSFLLPVGQSAEEKLLKRQKPTKFK